MVAIVSCENCGANIACCKRADSHTGLGAYCPACKAKTKLFVEPYKEPEMFYVDRKGTWFWVGY